MQAIEEGYDSDGDKVVNEFLMARDKDKRDAEAAEVEAGAAKAREAAEAAAGPAEVDDKKVVFKAGLKRSIVSKEAATSSTGEGTADGFCGSAPKKKKNKKKKLDNKKYVSVRSKIHAALSLYQLRITLFKPPRLLSFEVED